MRIRIGVVLMQIIQAVKIRILRSDRTVRPEEHLFPPIRQAIPVFVEPICESNVLVGHHRHTAKRVGPIIDLAEVLCSRPTVIEDVVSNQASHFTFTRSRLR